MFHLTAEASDTFLNEQAELTVVNAVKTDIFYTSLGIETFPFLRVFVIIRIGIEFEHFDVLNAEILVQIHGDYERRIKSDRLGKFRREFFEFHGLVLAQFAVDKILDTAKSLRHQPSRFEYFCGFLIHLYRSDDTVSIGTHLEYLRIAPRKFFFGNDGGTSSACSVSHAFADLVVNAEDRTQIVEKRRV